MDDEQLERELISLEPALNCSQAIDHADVLLKLALAAGHPGLCAERSEAFTGLLCCVLCGGKAEAHDDGNDSAILREYLRDICEALEQALNPPVVCGKRESTLCMSTIDLLRTAAFCLSNGHDNACREYTRDRRSGEGQLKGELWRILRNTRVTPERRQAYATAEAMHDNHEDGLSALRALADRSDDDLNSFVNSALDNLVCNIECMCIPILFDGQRLYAGLTIASTLFGAHQGAFGCEFMAKHVLNSSGSLISLARIQASVCAFLAMARIYTMGLRGLQCEDVLQRIDAFVATMATALKAKVGGRRRDSPGSITAAVECIATWFETAVHDSEHYEIVQNAFQAPVLELAEGSEALKELWRDFCDKEGVNAVSLWTAVQFLCTARSQIHGTAMCISTAVHIVLSGMAGNLVAPNEINGPFVINEHAKLYTAHYYRTMPTVVYTLPSDDGSDKPPARDCGRECKETHIIATILEKGRVRGQHEKKKLPETRLAASLVMLTMKESLQRDLPPEVSAAPSEGRKDLRRLWIKYLQTLPVVKHRRCQHEDEGSFLIERCRKGDDGRTTRDNVEKPWRDVLGGSVVATLLYPLAGEAFMYALENMAVDGQFVSTTNRCVDEFVRYMIGMADTVFDIDTAMAGEADLLEGRDYTDKIFAQQRAFIHAYCGTIQQTGTLWEAMQLTFSMHTRRDDDEAQMPARKRRLCNAPALPQNPKTVDAPTDELDSPSQTYRPATPESPSVSYRLPTAAS